MRGGGVHNLGRGLTLHTPECIDLRSSLGSPRLRHPLTNLSRILEESHGKHSKYKKGTVQMSNENKPCRVVAQALGKTLIPDPRLPQARHCGSIGCIDIGSYRIQSVKRHASKQGSGTIQWASVIKKAGALLHRYGASTFEYLPSPYCKSEKVGTAVSMYPKTTGKLRSRKNHGIAIVLLLLCHESGPHDNKTHARS